MFNKPGKKLKIFAATMFGISIIGSLIFFLSNVNKFKAFVILLIPASILISFIFNLIIYAFGDMCENVDLMRSNLYIISTVTEKRFPDLAEKDEEVVEDDNEIYDEKDDEENE
jgi:hypothetical protein